MYSIKAIYKKRMIMKSIKYDVNTDSYEEAMQMFNEKLSKNGIHEDNVVSYVVTKSIICKHCGSAVHLINTTNKCKCGAGYDGFGNEDAELQKIE